MTKDWLMRKMFASRLHRVNYVITPISRRANSTKLVEKISSASKTSECDGDREERKIFRIRHDQRGGAREARCECNDQVEMCG